MNISQDELKIEKEKLNRLVSEALINGIPLSQDKAVLEQSCKVDLLIKRMQIENNL